MKTGGKSPVFSPVGGANEAAHILSLMGGRAVIQGRKTTKTNTFQNQRKEVSNMAVSCMSSSRRLLSMLPAIRKARTVPRKLTSTIRALGSLKCPKSLHQGKNEKNGIAEAIPFLSCPTMFSYREAPFAVSFFFWCACPRRRRAMRSPLRDAGNEPVARFGAQFHWNVF